ncbi:hypothetical protein GCM10011491_40340 [Brucella endophytica]|uniref:Uncharacterized protein n=1 Tax=Brucella endophytica TaxID=1963359 RepID=A0A916SN33_9HYPH|nr:hypothetical protein [Brucella endophytica]GGB08253.1 hypothetical protein GCM10011491_40340 [Brucella endophytica]
MVATKESFFSPSKLSSHQKAQHTHDAAMQIVDAEAAARAKKTARLRQQRLDHEAANPPPEAPAPRRRKKA